MIDRFILIGHPVGHSMSPVIHQAAYRALGREADAEYGLVDAPTADDVRAQIDALRRGELKGINVTVPWKLVALEAADRVSVDAAQVGAANVLALEEGQIVAYNTDATGLADDLESLRTASGRTPSAKSETALVVGNGGAARAAVVACRLLGYDRVYVTARRYLPDVPREQWPAAAEFEQLGRLVQEAACVRPIESVIPWLDASPETLERIAPEVTTIIQATSAGMKGKPGGEALAAALHLGGFPSSPDRHRTTMAYDLVYTPPVTPFLREADAAGHVVRGGLGMLAGQAAAAIKIWWKLDALPPTEPMLAAAKKALGQ